MSKKITTEEWLSELFPAFTKRPENSFTVNDVVKTTGYKRGTAALRIQEKVDAGKLKKITCVENGKQINCYIEIKNGEQKNNYTGNDRKGPIEAKAAAGKGTGKNNKGIKKKDIRK